MGNYSKKRGQTVSSTSTKFIQVTEALEKVLFTSEERKRNRHRCFAIKHFPDGHILFERSTRVRNCGHTFCLLYLIETLSQNQWRRRQRRRSRGQKYSSSSFCYSQKQRRNTSWQAPLKNRPYSPGAYVGYTSSTVRDMRRRRQPHCAGLDDDVSPPDNKQRIFGRQPPALERYLAHLPQRVNLSNSERSPDDKQHLIFGGQLSALDRYLDDPLQCPQRVNTELPSGCYPAGAQEDYVVGDCRENNGCSSANEFSTRGTRYPEDSVVGELLHCNRILPNNPEAKLGGLPEVTTWYTKPWNNSRHTGLPQPHRDGNVGPCTNNFALSLGDRDEKAQDDLAGCAPLPLTAVNLDTFGEADGTESDQHWLCSAQGPQHEPSRHPTHLGSLGWSVML